jgi:hypothetical protein
MMAEAARSIGRIAARQLSSHRQCISPRAAATTAVVRALALQSLDAILPLILSGES